MDNAYTRLLEETKNKKIIAFGCGRYFNEFVLRYPSLVEKTEYILDNNRKDDAYSYGRFCIPVLQPTEIVKTDLMKYVIIFCADQWNEMKKQLDEITGQNYSYFHYPLEVDYRRDRELGIYHRIVAPVVEKLREYSNIENAARLLGVRGEDEVIRCLKSRKVHAIPRLTVVLTPKCSLRCKECNNLMWGFSDCSDLQTGKIMASLKNVINVFDFLPCIELIGGEPFAARNLEPVLDYLLGQEKVMSVEITTNATIVPSTEVIDKIKDHKVYIHISNYGNVVKQDKFVRCMEEKRIQFRMPESEEKWVAVGGLQKRNRDAGELVRQYYRCISGNLCKTLWEDKIFPCARAASLAALGIMSDCPYIDSSKEDGLAERLHSFYIVPSCGACDYCDVAVESPVYVRPAVQLERT